MSKFMLGIVGSCLLPSTSFAPVKAADVEFTIEREGQPAMTFELSDCEIHTSNPGGSATVDLPNHITTFKGNTTISALRDGKQVFFMSVKNAIVTLKRT